MLPKHSSQRNPALSSDTGLNLCEKTINCTQYYKNQSEKHIGAQIRIIVPIYSENVFPHEAD